MHERNERTTMDYVTTMNVRQGTHEGFDESGSVTVAIENQDM